MSLSKRIQCRCSPATSARPCLAARCSSVVLWSSLMLMNWAKTCQALTATSERHGHLVVLPHCLARSDERGDRERLGLRDGGSGHMMASSAAMLGSLRRPPSRPRRRAPAAASRLAPPRPPPGPRTRSSGARRGSLPLAPCRRTYGARRRRGSRPAAAVR